MPLKKMETLFSFVEARLTVKNIADIAKRLDWQGSIQPAEPCSHARNHNFEGSVEGDGSRAFPRRDGFCEGFFRYNVRADLEEEFEDSEFAGCQAKNASSGGGQGVS